MADEMLETRFQGEQPQMCASANSSSIFFKNFYRRAYPVQNVPLVRTRFADAHLESHSSFRFSRQFAFRTEKFANTKIEVELNMCSLEP